MTHLSIRTKLTAILALVMACSGAIGISSLVVMRQLESNIRKELKTCSRTVELAGLAAARIANMRAAGRGLVLFTIKSDPAELERDKATFRSEMGELEQVTAELEGIARTSADRSEIASVRASLPQWKRAFDEAQALCAQGDADGATRLLTARSQEAIVTALAVTDRVRNEANALLNQTVESAGSKARGALIVMFGLVCLGCLCAGATFLTIERINRGLRRIAAAVSEGAEQVASAAGQLQRSSDAIAQGTSEQAASLEETSASAQEVACSTGKNAESSASAASIVVLAAERVGEAEHTLTDLERSMAEISDSSGKIAKVLDIIDQIAFQTNLLALNAAIEAAHAGESGLGFAVVAGEVRGLAQKCAEAARSTSELVERAVATSRLGREKVDATVKAVGAVRDEAMKVKRLVEEVRVATDEQTHGVDQITKALLEIQHVTQQAVAQTEETASAGHELRSQADRLRGAVNDLNEMVEGSAAYK